jgi:hypothetical protein
VMGIISFGMVGIRQLAPGIPPPSLERLADALADLVDRGLATTHSDTTRADSGASSDAGKQAFRNLAEETKNLYVERFEAASGSDDSPHPQH